MKEYDRVDGFERPGHPSTLGITASHIHHRPQMVQWGHTLPQDWTALRKGQPESGVVLGVSFADPSLQPNIRK